MYHFTTLLQYDVTLCSYINAIAQIRNKAINAYHINALLLNSSIKKDIKAFKKDI